MSLDASIGASSSNSYVTVEEADAYLNVRLHGKSQWVGLGNEEKQSALITATQMLDWYVKWKGVKASETQSLQWPRIDAMRRDGTLVADDVIPQDVKTAVFELALISLAADRLADDPLAGFSMVKASVLQVRTDGGGHESTAKDVIPEHVKKICDDLSSRGNISVVRLMRA